jgi:multidrug efflux pump
VDRRGHFTPFIAYHLLPQRADARDDAGEPEEQYEGRFYGWFRRVLDRCLDRRKTVVAVALAMFVGSMLLFQIGVPRQFFPASDRPELVVDLQLSQNASFAQTQAVAARMEKLLARDDRVVSTTAYVGVDRRASTCRSMSRRPISRWPNSCSRPGMRRRAKA